MSPSRQGVKTVLRRTSMFPQVPAPKLLLGAARYTTTYLPPIVIDSAASPAQSWPCKAAANCVQVSGAEDAAGGGTPGSDMTARSRPAETSSGALQLLSRPPSNTVRSTFE